MRIPANPENEAMGRIRRTRAWRDPSGWRFLMAEIECGMTFVSLARASSREERQKYRHCVGEARKAYQTVLRFRDRVLMNDEEMSQLSAGLIRLENALEEVGGLRRLPPEPHAADSPQN